MNAPWKRLGFALPLGAAAGTLSGLLGIGGGLVVGPALALAGMSLPRAIGTALLVVAPVAAVGVVAEWMTAADHLAWTIALAVAVGGQIGAPAGAWIIVRLPVAALRVAFVLLLVYTALRSLGLVGGAAPDTALAGWAGDSAALQHGIAVIAGVFAGIASSLFGIGGGAVVVPALLFAVGGFTFHAAAGTSLLAMVPTAARGAWLANRQGRVEPDVARRILPAAVVAAIAAVVIRNLWLPPTLLAQVFGVFLLVVAWRLVWQRERSR